MGSLAPNKLSGVVTTLAIQHGGSVQVTDSTDCSSLELSAIQMQTPANVGLTEVQMSFRAFNGVLASSSLGVVSITNSEIVANGLLTVKS